MSRLTMLIESNLKARQLNAPHMLVVFPQGDADAPVLRAEIRHSRWIVLCPWCPGGTALDPDDLRFFCIDCCNAGAGHRYVPVVMPPDWPTAMERLMRRPDPRTRNYLTHETLADLIAEDAERGLP